MFIYSEDEATRSKQLKVVQTLNTILKTISDTRVIGCLGLSCSDCPVKYDECVFSKIRTPIEEALQRCNPYE